MYKLYYFRKYKIFKLFRDLWFWENLFYHSNFGEKLFHFEAAQSYYNSFKIIVTKNQIKVWTLYAFNFLTSNFLMSKLKKTFARTL